jgi:hypothetical protein
MTIRKTNNFGRGLSCVIAGLLMAQPQPRVRASRTIKQERRMP